MAARRPARPSSSHSLGSTGSTTATTATTSAPSGLSSLGLAPGLVSALAAQGITELFPIQAATLPDSLAGRDVLGRGRTGSGKTYAFLLPLVARLAGGRSAAGRPRGLVLAPTRELAAQIDEALAPLAAASGLRSVTIFGGVPKGAQVRALQRGVDIIVACPGRLADLHRSGQASLAGIEVTVIDEADHMADLGFLPVVRSLLDLTPDGGQRLLFSATLDAGVDVLVRRYLHDPIQHHVDDEAPADQVSHRVVRVDSDSRLGVIADLAGMPGRTVVFTRTKRGASKLAKQLSARGVAAVELHGDLQQNARRRNLEAFSTGRVQTLVATDIAARGIHVDDVALVIHADPPVDHKAYTHRSGRTARAGATGAVVTIALDNQIDDVRALARKARITPTFDGVPAGPPPRAPRNPDVPGATRAARPPRRGGSRRRRRPAASASPQRTR